ncbi:hypothetical protein HOL21_02925 [Candidatus Woesearchaeota archaeon]|jgi:hypothetical protein|nr:hypothetical protein [Candidatus Woesearchaeota archaeon]MBT5397140.1 hypothetical protein [Candidatus Woesearchaeota archaeon]MBT5924478.1 hypothetical protein [Candidatus Woesearchaeota archaeon]MBT6367314.1 hypothetical protein [Candidatus Woesearchaeota archaeon]MBT7762540.1 hypothetical protein [Candidatus Woesearchaeota archaeon]
MTTDFVLAKCKTKAAYSAKLKSPKKLNLQKIKEKFTVILETPILLVIKEQGIEIVVHGHGELLFKKCNDTALMESIVKKVYGVGLKK